MPRCAFHIFMCSTISVVAIFLSSWVWWDFFTTYWVFELIPSPLPNLTLMFVCVCVFLAGHLGPRARPERNADGQKTGEQHEGCGPACCNCPGKSDNLPQRTYCTRIQTHMLTHTSEVLLKHVSNFTDRGMACCTTQYLLNPSDYESTSWVCFPTQKNAS